MLLFDQSTKFGQRDDQSSDLLPLACDEWHLFCFICVVIASASRHAARFFIQTVPKLNRCRVTYFGVTCQGYQRFSLFEILPFSKYRNESFSLGRWWPVIGKLDGALIVHRTS